MFSGPRWASWNLGIFLCIRCAGIHRNLGVHISKVKSVNLDSWTAEQVAVSKVMGVIKLAGENPQALGKCKYRYQDINSHQWCFFTGRLVRCQ